MKYSCHKLTFDLLHLTRKGIDFCDDLRRAKPGKSNFKELYRQKDQLSQEVEGYIAENLTLDAILERIRNPELGQVLCEILDNEDFKTSLEKDYFSYYSLIRFLYSPLPIRANQDDIDKFYFMVNSHDPTVEAIKHIFSGVEDEKKRNEEIYRLQNALKSAMINSLMRYNKNLKVDNGSDINMSDYIATGMEQGELNISSAGNNLAYHMKGGIIRAGYVGNMAAMQMSGGEIYTEGFRDVTGMLMTGGRIYARGYAGEKFGWAASGGVFFAENAGEHCASGSGKAIFVMKNISLPWNKTGGVVVADHAKILPVGNISYTALVNDLEGALNTDLDKVRDKIRSSIYGYEDSTGEYLDHLHGKSIANPKTDEELENWKRQENGLCVVDDLSNIFGDPTTGLKDGIMVLRSIPGGEICREMEGGVVILEVDDLDYEEAQKRVKMDRNITGVVLLRLEDEEKPSKTKLVEVK